MQCKVTCYQAESNVHQLNTLRYVSCLKTRTKDNLIGCHKLAENFFQPLTIPGTKQSKRPRKDILCFEDLDTNDTAALQCYHLLFPCGIFLQVSSRGVYNLNDSFSWEKRNSLSVLHGHLNCSLFQDYEAAANKHLCFTQEGCRSGMLAQIPMPKEWYLFRGTRKTVRLRVPSSAVSKVSACAGWWFPI